MSEKELPPSEQKIKQAREKGQLGVSQDVVTFLKLVAVAELAFSMEKTFRQGVEQVVNAALQVLPRSSIHPFSVRMTAVLEAAVPLGLIVLSLVFTAAFVSWLGALVQTKLNFAPKVFAESLQKLNPVSNLKQIFSAKALMNLALGPFKIGSVLVVVSLTVWHAVPLALQIDRLAPLTVWHASLLVFREMLHSALLVLVFWMLLDVGLQRWMNWRELRMDKEEVKQEYKNMEGDPHAKSFRKSTGKEVLMSNDPPVRPAVVVVNPEHFAVALAYDYREESVPIVVGKGVDAAVQHWRELAHQEGIPVIRFRSLARQLYATGKVGDYVPLPMLAAVALLFQAAMEATQASQVDGDPQAVYEIDEEMAMEMLASAPRH